MIWGYQALKPACCCQPWELSSFSVHQAQVAKWIACYYQGKASREVAVELYLMAIPVVECQNGNYYYSGNMQLWCKSFRIKALCNICVCITYTYYKIKNWTMKSYFAKIKHTHTYNMNVCIHIKTDVGIIASWKLIQTE